jgi:hypothetical protein
LTILMWRMEMLWFWTKPFRVIDLENDYFFNFWNKLIMCMLLLVVLEQSWVIV